MLRTDLLRPLPELLREHADGLGNKIAFHDSQRSISYAELERRTRYLAGHLAGLGLQRGQVVAICLGDCVEFVESCLAAIRAAAIGVPLNPHSSETELAYLLEDSAATVVITDPAHVEQIRKLAPNPHRLTVVVTGDGETFDDEASFEKLAITEPASPTCDNLGLDETAWMLYTSGSTGKPKGVVSTQRSRLWSVAACFAPILGLSEADRVLWPLPLWHSLSHVVCVHGVIATGATARIMTGLSAADVLDVVRRESVTFLAGVPTMYHQLLRVAGEDDVRASSLRICLAGGALTTASLCESFEDVFGLPLTSGYGSTESCGPVAMNWRTGRRVPGSCGLPVPGVSVRVVHPTTGLDVDEGAEGELWVDSPGIMTGYHRQPEETAETLRGGWYHTGDLARQDEYGYLTISGRIKELIIRGGENVHPVEVEDVLRAVPGVADAAVVGKPHDVLGEVPVAFLVADPQGLDPQRIFAACRERLSYFKVPEELYEIDRIPRTGIGKINRQELVAHSAVPVATSDGSAPATTDLPDVVRLPDRLAAEPATERERVLLDLVRTEVAVILGQADTYTVETTCTFTQLGITSVTAVVLRDRLASATGSPLPATLAFDYPTPTALAGFLNAVLFGSPRVSPTVPPSVPPPEEPIAIIGMGCRYPGGVRDPDQLWRLVAEGGDGISNFPVDRGWDLDHLFDPDPDKAGTSYVRQGGFLHDAGDFDAEFFGISPREALAMDPQQRILLEISWETLEHAGIDPRSLRESKTGVYAGIMVHDYVTRLTQESHHIEGYLSTNATAGMVSGRISHTFGWCGPSITVDTTCSSSLVALHMAVQALRSGECALALAGGAAVVASPLSFVSFSRQRGLAPDGRCKSFSGTADGTAWSEGAGMLLIERLSDARRNNHRVLGLIRGSAVNSDGASNGITAPNGPAQQQLIRDALANAGLATRDVDVVEAHGTGTTLGDPIEAQAVIATYGQDRPEGQPLWLGSLKSNIGHARSAAGVGGVIKMVMAMQHGVLPRTLHVDQPSPHVDWTRGRVELLTRAMPWPHTDHPRRAGVSSFGISGTNAHVVLEQAAETAEPTRGDRPPVVPWVISGKTEAALRAQAKRLKAFVETTPEVDPVDVAVSLATTRAAFTHRAVVISSDREELLDGLGKLANGTGPGLVRGTASGGAMAVAFTGQGSQRPGMGRDLHAAFHVFADAFDAVCAEFGAHLAQPLKEVMWAREGTAEAELLDQTEYTQPALFALEVSLYRLVCSWGLSPDHLTGHSIGELVAAHVAGVLSLTDAVALVAVRGRLMQTLSTPGTMITLQASEDEVTPLLVGHESTVDIAAVNGPRLVVVSGEQAACGEIAATLEARGRKTARLQVSHAFHSPLMDPMLAQYRAVVESLTFGAPRTAIVSTLTGKPVDTEQMRSPDYWVDQVRRTVRFADAVTSLHTLGARTLLELGPAGVLTTMARDSVPETTELVAGLSAKLPEPIALITAMARLHARGIAVDWAAVLPGGRSVALPTYAFQHRRYWPQADDTASRGDTSTGTSPARLPALDGTVGIPDITGAVSTESTQATQVRNSIPAVEHGLVLHLVRTVAATVLGHGSADAIEVDTEFGEYGLDSLTAIDLRNQLQEVTGLSLETTLAFDYSTSTELAHHLHAALTSDPGA